MTVIDPYKMELRFTYDINKWMAINETITATYYDYRTHSFHMFFNNNKYRIWKVNVSLMNSLPMGWDRAFLHGSLSDSLKINRDFFKMNERELREYSQPYFQPEVVDVSDDTDDDIDEEETVEENLENNLQENSHKKEFQLITEISNDLENKKVDNNFQNDYKNSLFQRSDEVLAVSPVMANLGPALIHCHFVYLLLFCFHILYYL